VQWRPEDIPLPPRSGFGARPLISGGVVPVREEDKMAVHKFTLGQTVRFSPDRQQTGAIQGWFKIVRLLPETGSVLQYRVKSQLDGHERVVREDQLARS
jgi:hypothetical protein